MLQSGTSCLQRPQPLGSLDYFFCGCATVPLDMRLIGCCLCSPDRVCGPIEALPSAVLRESGQQHLATHTICCISSHPNIFAALRSLLFQDPKSLENADPSGSHRSVRAIRLIAHCRKCQISDPLAARGIRVKGKSDGLVKNILNQYLKRHLGPTG